MVASDRILTDRILTVTGWDAPASLPESAIGNWRIKKMGYGPGFFEMHNVLGYRYADVQTKGKQTLLQERRGTRWKTWMVDDALHWNSMGGIVRDIERERAVLAWCPSCEDDDDEVPLCTTCGGTGLRPIKVLVLGLGLGLILQHLRHVPDCSVDVVEREQDVIDLVWPHRQQEFDQNILIKGDFFTEELTLQLAGDYDFVVMDFLVGTPNQTMNDLFNRLYDRINLLWPTARAFYHGVEPWARNRDLRKLVDSLSNQGAGWTQEQLDAYVKATF